MFLRFLHFLGRAHLWEPGSPLGILALGKREDARVDKPGERK
jgi:hypothetical protein